MIEVVQRNKKGNLQHLGWFTKKEFAKRWNTITNIRAEFANVTNKIVFERVPSSSTLSGYINIPVFAKVAYNESGKLMTVDSLIGLMKHFQLQEQRFPHRSRRINKWSGFRRFKTTQERRQFYACDDSDVRIRSKRNPNNLPDSWDDYIRTSSKDRCWKRYRKHQWK